MTAELIDVYAAAGLLPADDCEGAPAWLADRYDAARVLNAAGDMLVTSEGNDEVYVAVITKSGVIYADIRIDAPEGEITDLSAKALAAILAAWSS